MSAAHTNPAPVPTAGPSSPTEPFVRDAVVVLTRLARLTYPTRDGGTERVDFAGCLAEVLASVAANVDGVEELLAGRSGSWEADLVRRLVSGTVGYEGESLALYRTEPISLDVDVEALLYDRTDGAWEDAWELAWQRATDAEDALYEQARAQHVGEDWLAPVLEDASVLLQPTTPQARAAAREHRDRVEAERQRIYQLHPDAAAAYDAVIEVDRTRNATEDAYRAALLAAATSKARELGYQVPVVHEFGAATWLGEQLLTHALNVVPAPVPPGPDWTPPAPTTDTTDTTTGPAADTTTDTTTGPAADAAAVLGEEPAEARAGDTAG